jgi:hypothetical protein
MIFPYTEKVTQDRKFPFAFGVTSEKFGRKIQYPQVCVHHLRKNKKNQKFSIKGITRFRVDIQSIELVTRGVVLL